VTALATAPPDAEAVVAFLSRACAYPGRPESVERIETHMSWIFLAGELVYKIKKPVRLDFVDFSALEARRRNCERELAINRRLAPGVYLGVEPLALGSDGELAIGGGGDPVEWLLVMRRLDERRLLDRALAGGGVAGADIDGLCDLLAGFYRETPRVDIAPDELVAWWRELVALSERALRDPRLGLAPAEVERPLHALHDFLDREAGLLAARAVGGRILDGHGDLRPEHVYLGPPMLVIDRLEFDERLRRVDPFDETGFLGLECERLGAAWIGRRLRERLARRLRDRPPEPLLRFYRCYRACLRARLSIEHLRDPEPRTPERWPRQARAYLALALGPGPSAQSQGSRSLTASPE
jgi:aminoglycoside phosphotransferase family enzyme